MFVGTSVCHTLLSNRDWKVRKTQPLLFTEGKALQAHMVLSCGGHWIESLLSWMRRFKIKRLGYRGDPWSEHGELAYHSKEYGLQPKGNGVKLFVLHFTNSVKNVEDKKHRGYRAIHRRLGEIKVLWDCPERTGPWSEALEMGMKGQERLKSCLSQGGSVANQNCEVRERRSEMISCLGDWLEPIMEERRWVQFGTCWVWDIYNVNYIAGEFRREILAKESVVPLKLWEWTLLLI